MSERTIREMNFIDEDEISLYRSVREVGATSITRSTGSFQNGRRYRAFYYHYDESGRMCAHTAFGHTSERASERVSKIARKAHRGAA